jgi:Ca2+-binding RTX toxin-like protein
VLGTSGKDPIKFSRDPAGNILTDDGTVPVLGGTPTIANTSQILAFGQGGNDTITLDETNGALPAAQLFGGDGNDVLTGGTGNDQVFGQAGVDTMIWNPGDGSDLFEGGDGNDTAQINGGNGSETFTISANGTRVLFDRTDQLRSAWTSAAPRTSSSMPMAAMTSSPPATVSPA